MLSEKVILAIGSWRLSFLTFFVYAWLSLSFFIALRARDRCLVIKRVSTNLPDNRDEKRKFEKGSLFSLSFSGVSCGVQWFCSHSVERCPEMDDQLLRLPSHHRLFLWRCCPRRLSLAIAGILDLNMVVVNLLGSWLLTCTCMANF
ncbi:hypothetical protein DAPPUDRAFT_315829 [Daphnia pulex]|uniref:Transmembrane protein n=1 Tax=Daphnia pulex TaxID=6669 RepID=E9GAY7_DAPPU|nr:hypothetical protein DAPPUDRAFT_315829 [Daphnia pulex]|eukprot:EFX83463.1 hypothetical protein DAPPUDRAFT_315829 [Daphnia pulex]